MRELAVRAAALGNTLAALVDRDAEAYAAVAATYKLPADTPALEAEKKAKIDRALLAAAAVPLETAAACAAVAELALAVAERGNTNAASDAGIAALLAEAGCIGASYNVRINVVALSDRSLGAALELEARQLVQKAGDLARKTSEAVERVLAQ
jgi:glutamate formiminotransferase/formiminotetrahydrofolate cyclodeaminase